MKNSSKFGAKEIIICALALIAIVLLLVFGRKSKYGSNTNTSTEETKTKSESTLAQESTDAKTTDEFVFPSVISTEDMSPEEIAELESRIREDESLGDEFNEDGRPARLDPIEVEEEQDPWTAMKESQKESYKNTVKKIELGNGYLTIGRNLGNTDALYLNPTYESDDGRLYGFYICRNLWDGELETSTTEYYSAQSTYFNCDSYSYIADRTLDSLLTASYKDATDYGIRWYDSSLMGEREGEDRTMYIRVIDLYNDNIVGTARLEIKWLSDEHVYAYGNLEDADAVKAGTVNAAKKEALINAVLESGCPERFFSNNDMTEESWAQLYKEQTQIEEILQPYNEKALSTDGYFTRYNPSIFDKLYAVTLVAPDENDYLTVYVEECGTNLYVMAYEPYHLHSHQSIAVASPSKEKLFLDFDELVRQWGK